MTVKPTRDEAQPRRICARPIEKLAIQFNFNYAEIAAFIPAEILAYNTLQHRIFIQTPEGTMEAVPGDWIIRGIAGEFYPCKPDIFEETYEFID